MNQWLDKTNRVLSRIRVKTFRNIPERKRHASTLRNWLLPILGFFVVAASGIAGCSSGGSDATVVKAVTTVQGAVQSTTTVAPTPEEEVIEDLRQAWYTIFKSLETPGKPDPSVKGRVSGEELAHHGRALKDFASKGWKAHEVGLDQFDIDLPEVKFKDPKTAVVNYCLIDRTVLLDKNNKPRGVPVASTREYAVLKKSGSGVWTLETAQTQKRWEDALGCDR